MPTYRDPNPPGETERLAKTSGGDGGKHRREAEIEYVISLPPESGKRTEAQAQAGSGTASLMRTLHRVAEREGISHADLDTAAESMWDSESGSFTIVLGSTEDDGELPQRLLSALLDRAREGGRIRRVKGAHADEESAKSELMKLRKSMADEAASGKSGG